VAKFAYRAKRGPNEVVNGTIEGQTLEEAVEKLDAMGLLPVHVEIERDGSSPAPSRKPEKKSKSAAAPEQKIKKRGRIKGSDITMFGRQLSSLIRSGVPILRALQIISEQTESHGFKTFLSEAQEEIKNGSTLSSVLVRYPKLFPPIYIAMVRTGEDSGALQETLLRVSEYRKKQEELFSKVRAAMAYPVLMATVGVGTIIFMMTFVIPKLTTLFSTMGESLPAPTRIMMQMSAALQKPLVWLVAGGVLFAIIALLRSKNKRVALWRSGLALKTPVFSDFIIKTELARFARTLELLIRSGTSILRALEITTPVASNLILRATFESAQQDLAGGGTLGASLKNSGRIPLFMTNLVAVGEESGNLDDALSEVANFYESETEEAIKIVTSLLEPIMMLVMGVAVGFIVIAMLLPMFELNLAVK